jgi:hypothetical protein
MGSGNFGGGGSVRWQVRYDEPAEGNPGGGGKPLRGHGRDRGSGTEPGTKLYVICSGAVVHQASGTVVVEVTLANDADQVVLKWGNDVTANPADLWTRPTGRP